ncbi:hypothetical protein GW17_00019336 [Ensete ventricosum]|nr:hypothetical protein GW17_00019336 [Ensete ventricosum]
MALKTLNFPIHWRSKPSLPNADRRILGIPPRRSARPASPVVAANGNNGFRRIGDGGSASAEKGVEKNVDLVTLGNLCVDIVLGVPSLPPASKEERRAYMERLAASPPHKNFWEAGGNCNLAIAAARLGLLCFTLGHVGDEIYGNFLLNVLHDENISLVGMSKNVDITANIAAYETLLCWVLVDPFQKHGFCRCFDLILYAQQVNVVDSVGCGDSFTAAIAFGFLHGMPTINTLALANAVGAATATGCGAGRNVAQLCKVLELLKQSNLNEDDKFWSKLIEGNSLTSEVLLLSKVSINGSNGRLVRIPISNVVFELVPKFDAACESSVTRS